MTGIRKQSEPRQRGGGEQIDIAAHDSIKLAHRALDRFPNLVKRHRYVAGGAAVAGALVALAGVAVARRMRQGQTAEEAVAGVTQEEIESLQGRSRIPATEEGLAETQPLDITRANGKTNGNGNGSGAHTEASVGH